MSKVKTAGLTVLAIVVLGLALIGGLTVTRGTPVGAVVTLSDSGPPTIDDSLFVLELGRREKFHLDTAGRGVTRRKIEGHRFSRRALQLRPAASGADALPRGLCKRGCDQVADAWVARRLAERGRRISGVPVTYRARFWSVVRCYPESSSPAAGPSS